METKRKVSILIPYWIKDGQVNVYLQRRSPYARRSPDYFGFFGGGAEEGESPEDTLKREMKEEISFVPEGYRHFKKYEFERSIAEVFMVPADDSFESRVTILEGEYGKWFSEQEVRDESKLIEHDKTVLEDLYRFLKNG